MIYSVAVTWKAAKAHYHLQDDGYPVFEGHLVNYEGPAALAPPSFLVMVKAGDHWISDVDLHQMVQHLGRSIEALQNTPAE